MRKVHKFNNPSCDCSSSETCRII